MYWWLNNILKGRLVKGDQIQFVNKNGEIVRKEDCSGIDLDVWARSPSRL